MTDSEQQKFRIISGGKDRQQIFCGIPINLVVDDHSPLDVDALACEEDRFLVMSQGADVSTPREHPLRIINQAWRQEPLPVGSVLFRKGSPSRFLLVVHDLERSPTCRPIWILAAMAGLKEQLNDHPEIRSLALPLLGTRHSNLKCEETLNLLRQALSGANWTLKQLILMVPETELAKIRELLKQNPD